MALEGGTGGQARQMEIKSLVHPFGKYLSSVSHVSGTMEALVPSGEQARVTNLKPSGLRETLSAELEVTASSASPLSGIQASHPISPEKLEPLTSVL